jgi:thiamine-monophosphate kinase
MRFWTSWRTANARRSSGKPLPMTNSRFKPRRLGEFAMIAKYFAPLAKGSPGAFALNDDVAILKLPKGAELIAKVDAIVEGVHFFRNDPPDSVAMKALRVNLSDLAAKGAIPLGYLLSLSLAPWVGDAWIAGFARGLAKDQKRYGLDLLGGDTTATPGALTISITVLGQGAARKTPRRAGASPGDLVFVTGTIGDAGAGLEVLKGAGRSLSPAERAYLVRRYRLPEPRLSLGRLLAPLVSASLDVSDGLIADLGHIAEVSKVAIDVDASCVPLHKASRKLWGDSALTKAAASGDDYEIAFTAPPRARARIAAAARKAKTEVTQIGAVREGKGVRLLDRGHKLPLRRTGYTHF